MHIPRALAVTFPLLVSRQAFETYDSCAENCFVSNIATYGAKCGDAVDSQQIACICQDSTYSAESAICIYTTCGATILNSTAAQHVANCNINGSPAAVDAQDFIAYGEGGKLTLPGTSASSPSSTASSGAVLPTTTSPPSTSTGTGSGSGSSNSSPTTTKSSAEDSATQTSSSPATSSSASSGSDSSNTLSTAALVGTIVGSVTGAIGSFAGVYFAWKSYKLKKEEKKKESSEGQPQTTGT